MLTVGELLQRARVDKRLTLEQVEKATHIRRKFLEAIEKNQLDKLPPGTFARGFVKNYASYLGLSPEDTLAFYRRQVDENKTKIMTNHRRPFGTRRIAITPQVFTTLSVVLLLVIFFAYLMFSYFNYAGAPALVVNSPENNRVVNEEQIKVNGKTDPDAKLTINNQPVAVSPSGEFSVDVPLQSGLNTLTIVASNKFNRQSAKTINIRLEK
ncbi:MAG: putative transcription regulation protein [Microgenomates group bacterium GW2011_GWA1_48_10]|uniref:HTH cro/C1-type domain-containing protein n=1 Tax=Candidatus Gottesmanbacteria bacterium RIFCSPHIGHO2_01_FULL_47_48 TaxID=1798381 RepID=A0A1F6A4W4_9BACT|nr:MAG: putative transcription regulation protein [Microgenomates group bacterium GW2011_GWA1_48_10]OGG19778.1 MAG: hypothetical protein A2721_01235 [Candidatus Gottesmanbacteria bacterium RIFCSPHIGHO2_01_FULL_47_48]